MGQMKQYRQLLNELPSKTIVFAFGRFNPPTTGHELLMKVVQRLAQQKRADHVVFASKSQDAKKNPLSIEKKMRYLKMMFPRVNFRAADNNVRTFIEACVALHNMGYKNVIMVAGSDRYQTFNTTLNKYNGKKDRHGFYKFDTIEVISSGQRDPDDDTTPSGMSGTKMREHAKKGDLKSFKKGLPATMREIDARRLMNDVRMGMNMPAIREEIVLEKDTIREKYFRGEIFNVGDMVTENNKVYEVAKRGSNHLLVRDIDGNLESKWIQDVKEVPMNEAKEKGLTNKTVRKTDRIKVARMIAMMLGVDNPETGSPEALVNMGLRKVRVKALNPEAIRLVAKILDLAKAYDIKYDQNMVPSKLKEEKLPTVKKIDKKRKDNISTDILNPSDFRKLKKMSEESPEGETESDMDAQHDDSPAHTEVGGLMNPPYNTTDDNLRRRKVMYMRNEDTSAPQQAERSAKKIAKAKQMADHEAERLSLAKKHAREKAQLSKESALPKFSEYLEENKAVRKKANASGVSYSTLIKVYRRGVAAWNSGHRPGTTPEQWGLARVNSYINKGKGTYHGADKDLREEQIDEKMKRVPKDKESGEPKKYVAGLSKSTAKARAAHWDKMDKLDDRDPKAYEPAPGDKTAKTKPSKHTIAYKKKFGEDYLDELLGFATKRPKTTTIVKKSKPAEPSLRDKVAAKRKEYSKLREQETLEQKHSRWLADLDELENDVRDTDPQMVDHIQKRREEIMASMDEAIVKPNSKVKHALEKPHDEKWEAHKEEVEMCPDACCGKPVTECTCGPDCEHCDCYEKNKMNEGVRDYEKDINITDFTDDEIEEIVDDITDDEIFDEILNDVDEDDLMVVDDEGNEVEDADVEIEGELDEETIAKLDEVLTRAGRIKAKINLRKTSAKRKRGLKIALKRRATTKVANKRARRLATKALKKRFLQGRSPSKLSVSERERIERIVASKKKIINRIALKMVPRVRKMEQQRMGRK